MASSGRVMIFKVVACVVLMCMVVGAPPRAEAAVTCGTVVNALRPCLPYLTGKTPLPPACCSGVRNLNSAANTPADRRTACACIKSASRGVNPGLAAGLPSKCGVSIPYKISPSTDCSKVQ